MEGRRKKLAWPLLALLFLGFFVWTLLSYNIPCLFHILTLKFIPPLSTSFMRSQSLETPWKRAKYNWVSSDKISKYLKDAVVVAEDDRFYEHAGIDWEAMQKAAVRNWKRRRLSFGASTITQQLVKNLYLSPSKDPLRKVREVGLALMIDSYLSKEEILELYLNVAEWGPNIFGAEAAAKYHFGISARYLNAEQAAFLASILPNPNRGKVGFHMSDRAQSILRRIQ